MTLSGWGRRAYHRRFIPPADKVRVRGIALEVNLTTEPGQDHSRNFTSSPPETVFNVDKELQRKVSKGAPITLLDTMSRLQKTDSEDLEVTI